MPLPTPILPTRLIGTRRIGTRLLTALLLLIAVASTLLPRPVQARTQYRVVGIRETYFDVAYEWKTTPETIRLLNDLAPSDIAWAGQRLEMPPAKGRMLHEVIASDSPASIAAAHGVPVPLLVELNGISPQERLAPGTRLWLPSPEGPLHSAEVPKHRVAEGDTLESVATAYRTSVRRLIKFNPVDEDRDLKPGMVLIIPPLSLHEQLELAPVGPSGLPMMELSDFPSFTEKWVEVDLSVQRVIAWEGMRPVQSFLISSGKSKTPTVRGVFRIRAKISAQTMEGGSRAAGDYYNLPNVQWVAYFYRDYSFHGTYWHKNFGTPMSHGCVNMTNADAQWLYEWMAPVNPGRGWFDSPADEPGTLVIVHN